MITIQGLDLSIEQLPKDKRTKLNRYLNRELNHLRTTDTTNSTYLSIFNTLNNIDLPSPTPDGTVIIPTYATYLMSGIDLIKELIIMTRRVGMFTGSDNSPRSKRFKNKIINEINQVSNEKLYSVNRDAFKFHLTTKNEMINYLKLLIQ